LIRFFLKTIALYTLVYAQSYVLARLPSQWFHIDLVTIFVLFVCIEKNLFSSLTVGLIAGIILHSLSSAPTGIFIVYFLSCSILSNVFSKIFLFNGLFFKSIVFCLLYLLKYVVLYFSLNNKHTFDFFLLLLLSWKSIVATLSFGFIAFPVLYKFDNLFQYFYFYRKNLRLGRYA